MNHETPPWAERMLRVAGGDNRFGDPNFRVTWGENLLDWIGGKWEDRDDSGTLIRTVAEVRKAHKYPMYLDRWIVEKWIPPEKYGTPETWYRQTREWGEEGNVPQLGPYPARGRYAFVCVLDINGRFVQLGHTILEEIVVAAIYKREHIPSLAQLKQAQEEKKDREIKQMREFLDRPAFNANEFVSYANPEAR